MTLDEVKASVADMTETQQNELMAFVVHLRHQRDPQLLRDITQRIDDRDPSRWLTLDALKETWKE